MYYPLLKIIPCSYWLTLNLHCIWINSCSFYIKTYGIEQLWTWIKSHSLYNKTCGIEPHPVLSVLWWVTFLPYPDIQAIFDKHLLCVIIFVIPVIDRDITLPYLWYQSQFAYLIVVFCGSPTQYCGEWVESAVFCQILFGIASL